MTPKRSDPPRERPVGERRETRAVHLMGAADRAEWENTRKAKGLPARTPAERDLLEAELRHLEDPQAFPHEQLLAARRAAYRERLAATPQPRWLLDWAGRMATAYGPVARVHLQPGLDWVTTYWVVRYGEDPEKWPARLGADEERRISTWDAHQMKGWPIGVSLIPRDAGAVTYQSESAEG